MKNLFKLVLIFSILVLTNCSKKDTELYKEQSVTVLIAYEINTPSKIWIKDLYNARIHEVIISQYRREPNIGLNDSIKVVYSKNIYNRIINIDIDSKNFIKIPDDSINKIISLENYYKVYRK